MAVKEIKDFSRGYATDLLPDDVPDNVLQAATNFYFDGKFKKRRGYKTFFTDATANAEIVGHFYSELNAKWITIEAREVSNVITFHTNYTNGTSFTEIDATFTWSGVGPVRADVVNQHIVLVDSAGVNDPAVIYYDSAVVIETLDEFDTRTIEDPFWWAGQYDESEDVYTDDTTDAQSSTTTDFNMASTTANDGFYVASAKIFSNIKMKTAEQMAGSPVAVYEYYDGDSWETLTLTTTPTWTAAAGDRELEFTPPSDWAIWDGTDPNDADAATVPGGMTGNYIVRVTFSTAPSAAVDCAYIEVKQTKAVTTALFGEIPTNVVAHNSRIFLIVGNSVNYSLYGQTKGFEAYFAEYFAVGGAAIRAAKTMDKALYVVKDEAIHRLSGTNPEEFVIEIVANVGTTDGDSCAVVRDYLCFSTGEQLYVFTGTIIVEVGTHIRSEIPTTGVGAESEGFYWLIASDRVIRFNPDTVKSAPWGGSYAAMYRYTNSYNVKSVMKYIGTNNFSDTKLTDKLVGYVSGAATLVCMEYGDQKFDETDTVVPVTWQTKMYAFGVQTQNKIYREAKPLISQSGSWTFTTLTDRDETSFAVTLASGTAGTYYQEHVTLPYTVDSDTIGFKLYNNTVNDVVIYAVSLDVDLRPY